MARIVASRLAGRAAANYNGRDSEAEPERNRIGIEPYAGCALAGAGRQGVGGSMAIEELKRRVCAEPGVGHLAE